MRNTSAIRVTSYTFDAAMILAVVQEGRCIGRFAIFVIAIQALNLKHFIGVFVELTNSL